jgi:hypothetical protein
MARAAAASSSSKCNDDSNHGPIVNNKDNEDNDGNFP